MEKYMGNKSKLNNFIFDNIVAELNQGEKVFYDGFAGTTNVGRFFKDKGFQVISNDVNDLSYVLGKCYLENNVIPEFTLFLNSSFYSTNNFTQVVKTESFISRKEKILSENKNMLSAHTKEYIKNSVFLDILVYLTYYSTPADYDNEVDNGERKSEMKDFLQRNYCEEGENAQYINLVYKKTIDNSVKKINNKKYENFINSFYLNFDLNELKKAKKYLEKINADNMIQEKINKVLKKTNIIGKRKFFSAEHAKRLDIIINTICYWKNNNIIEENEFYILMAAVLESIAIFSNTSATYQAFYKDYRANTTQSFRLIIPNLNIRTNKGVVLRGDIFDNLNKTDYDVLYLDPPYNWRQYDSNYHLLNTISKINEIENIPNFEKGIIGASGENREQKLKYTSFNQKETFEDKLFEIIKRSKCSVIAISYSDSESNHRVDNIKSTLEAIETFLQEADIFIPGSYKKIEYERQNFESRKSNKKLKIREILFIARKRGENE